MTYGQLIDEAKRQLSRSLTAPITLPTATDALVVCDARTRLYRVVAGGIVLHLNDARGGDPPALDYRGGGIKRSEATLLEHLRADLLPSAAASSDTPLAPARTTGIAARMTRAADVAGAAFDLLAGHLTAADRTATPPVGLLGGDGIRVTARDVVQLTRAMTHLDRRLELPIRSAARTEADEHARQRLLAAADDCNRIAQQGVDELATAIHGLLRAPARQTVDSLDIHASHAPLEQGAMSPAPGAALVGELLAAVRQQPDHLSVPDLATIASIGARASVLTAYACAPVGGPVGPALEAARQWRSFFQHLAPFTTPSPGRNLTAHAHQFRSWADPLIRHRSPASFTNPAWLTATKKIANNLAKLAQSLTRTIAAQLTAGELLVSFDPHTRGREHLYTAVHPSDQRATQLRQATTATHHTARDLAVMLGRSGSSTNRREVLAPRPPIHAETQLPAEATARPPLPPSQSPRAPHR